jgi:hypothetical protein
MNHPCDEIQVWEYAKAPERLRRLTSDTSAWIAFIPAALVSPEVEVLFMRWDSGAHPVSRRQLSDGAIVLYGTHPSAAALTHAAPGNIASKSGVLPDAHRSSNERQ